MKKTLSILLAAAMMFLLTACGESNGESKWVGTYSGLTASGKLISVVINDNNKVIYNSAGEIHNGTWEEEGDELRFYFDGSIGEEYEPLLVTMSSDGNSIIVDSESSHWRAGTFIRQ